MKHLSIRLPESVIEAYDHADGTRSELMREVLTEPVADGELEVPDRYRNLARAERAKQRARWDVKDAGIRGRAYKFVAQRWEDGTHPPDALRRACRGFAEEAAVASEDEEAVAYIEAMLAWVEENWPADGAAARGPFPDAAEFHGEAEALAAQDPADAAVERAEELRDAGLDSGEAVERLATDDGYGLDHAFDAVREVYDDVGA